MDTTIQMKISNSIEDRIGTKPSTETVELLIRGLAGCDNRQDFYIFCLRNLGETAGYNFYKKVRSSFEEMVSVVRVRKIYELFSATKTKTAPERLDYLECPLCRTGHSCHIYKYAYRSNGPVRLVDRVVGSPVFTRDCGLEDWDLRTIYEFLKNKCDNSNVTL